MSAGRLIAVVGPSGVGKDSIMDGILRARPDFGRVRRTITRAPDLGGEHYDAVTEDKFHEMAASGAFCVHWRAHGLSYGIPAPIADEVAQGRTYLANFSRAALARGDEVFASFFVLNITAKPSTLAQRLADRGRESGDEIAGRLAQAAKPLPQGLAFATISNDGPLDQAIAQALAALQPVRA